jgi:hypothetical protein
MLDRLNSLEMCGFKLSDPKKAGNPLPAASCPEPPDGRLRPMARRTAPLVLSSIAHVLSNFARGNLGDADRVGDGVGGSALALRTSRH